MNRIIVISLYTIVIVTLLFGLWPLNLFPRNAVQWLDDEPGINFHSGGIENKYSSRGIVFSENTFEFSHLKNNDIKAFSIEVYLQSKYEQNHNIGTIITFKEDNESSRFLLAQWKKSLILRTFNSDENSEKNYREVGIRDALPKDSVQFLSITSGTEGTKLYLNGLLKEHFPSLFLVSDDKSIIGQLILGNSGTGKEPWAGSILGLSIFEEELTITAVNHHYQKWKSNDANNLLTENNLIALYTFEEGEGDVTKNKINTGNNLIIPERFITKEKIILELPWSNFNFNLSFLFDFFINLFGFIPIGIMISLYLGRQFDFEGKKLFLITVIIGANISLMIELLQIMMPQRNSSLSDLILNIIGLCFGSYLAHYFIIIKKKEGKYNFTKI